MKLVLAMICRVLGHRLKWVHPQQEASWCRRCDFVFDRHGNVVGKNQAGRVVFFDT